MSARAGECFVDLVRRLWGEECIVRGDEWDAQSERTIAPGGAHARREVRQMADGADVVRVRVVHRREAELRSEKSERRNRGA
eukprot:scaffold33026_cov129-Isochrysis_galbana.AAC.1